jgi:hypothetical protein
MQALDNNKILTVSATDTVSLRAFNSSVTSSTSGWRDFGGKAEADPNKLIMVQCITTSINNAR